MRIIFLFLENQLFADLDQILVSRSDIEEKNSQLDKMRSKYDELSMHHEYQIKLKEMNHLEKIKELKGLFEKLKNLNNIFFARKFLSSTGRVENQI